MVDRWIVFAVSIALAATTGALGCSTHDCPDDAELVEKPDDELKTDAREAFEDAAGWLPEQTTAVIVGADLEERRFGSAGMMPTVNPAAKPGEPGTLEGLQTDLERLFVDRIGFAPDRASAVVFGLNLSGLTTVLLGDFEELEGLEEVELDTRTGYRLDLTGEEFNDIDDYNQLFLLPFDEPRRGLVATSNFGALQQLDRAREGGDHGSTLASGHRAEVYEALFADTEGSSFAIASLLGDVEPFVAFSDTPLPDAMVLDYGDHVGLTLEADGDALAVIEADIAERISEYGDKLQRFYDEEPEGLVEGYSAIYAYHGFESIAGQLQPERSDGRLRYEVQLTEASWGGLAVVTMFIAGTLAHLMEPFDDFTPPGPLDDWNAPRAQTPGR